MIILALDMATTTGWALYDTESGLVESGIWVFKHGSKPFCLEARLIYFNNNAGDFIRHRRVKAVVYELAHFRGGPATRSAVGMETMIKVLTYRCGIPAFGVHTGTLKKYATGKGNASKGVMVSVANEFTHKEITSDDEADAICLAKWGGDNLEVVLETDGRKRVQKIEF